MKLKFYLLISLVTFSVTFLFAQQYTSVSGLPYKMKDDANSKKQIFYSKGKMYVAPRINTTETSMYVQGSMLFTDQASVRQQGITDLTGDFVLINTGYSAGSTQKFLFELPNTLSDTFNPEGYKYFGNYNNTGLVRFVGKFNRQDIYTVYGSGMPGALRPANLKNQLGFIANFPRVSVIKDSYDFPGGKLTFPTILSSEFEDLPPSSGAPIVYDPEQIGFVNVYDNMGVSISMLDINNGNRFRANINSKFISAAEAGLTLSSSVDHYSLNYSYLDINEMISTTAKGVNSELSMRLYDYTVNADGSSPDPQIDSKIIRSNTTNAQIVPPVAMVSNYPTFLRSFTSPFERLRTDYMYFHVLTQPNGTDTYDFLYPPKALYDNGQSYYYAMDLTNQYFDNVETISHLPSGAYKERARGGYLFSRLLRTYKIQQVISREGNSQYENLLAKSSDPYTSSVGFEEQRFITGNVNVTFNNISSSADDVTTDEAGGFIYLANPYLVPISLDPFLEASSNQDNDNPFQPSYNGVLVPGVKSVSKLTTTALANAQNAGDLLVRSRYWVMNTGVVMSTTDDFKFYYSTKFDLVDKLSSASTILNKSERVIQPLQTFAFQAATSGTFTFIPQMKVRNGLPFDISFDPNPYSRAISEEELEQDITPDWFFIQAVSKEGGDLSADRTAVRFFNDGKNEFDTNHDVVKNLGNISSVLEKTSIPISENGLSALRSGQSDFTPSNALYTKKTGNMPLLASSGKVGLTKELPLYYIPANNEETVELSFHGLDGFDEIKSVYLVDRHELGPDNKPIKVSLVEGSTYTFTSYSNNEGLNKANRFILLFEDQDDNNGPNLNDSPISSYYNSSTLYVQGLTENDKGSIIQIYDMQGRLMGTTKINSYPAMEYYKPLGLGTFIVRIIGNRSFDNKFVNTQNY